jgi:hypothetical protein
VFCAACLANHAARHLEKGNGAHIEDNRVLAFSEQVFGQGEPDEACSARDRGAISETPSTYSARGTVPTGRAAQWS